MCSLGRRYVLPVSVGDDHYLSGRVARSIAAGDGLYRETGNNAGDHLCRTVIMVSAMSKAIVSASTSVQWISMSGLND